MFTGSPTDPKLDRWLRKHPPKVELALSGPQSCATPREIGTAIERELTKG
jgi:hypothetical protein